MIASRLPSTAGREATRLHVARATLASLRDEPTFRCIDFVKAVAMDVSAPQELRAAAISCLGRFAASHPLLAEGLVPVAVELTSEVHPFIATFSLPLASNHCCS